MRALLDTNIIIHRENKRVTNYSIGHLYRWLDRMGYEKVIHPYSVTEIQKYKDPETQEVLSVKLDAYNVLRTIKDPTADFLALIGIPEKTENDYIDDSLLYQVYVGRVDILITEDRRLRNKATKIGLSDKVFSINAFITDATSKNPELIEYKMLAVEKTYFGNVDLTDVFFDSFRKAYDGFDSWFEKKCDEEAYICKDDTGEILGFLYLKTETESENYSDIVPPFAPKRRLKVGTFKVESTGFRLGERFVKIIFDNALQRKVDEIYVTLFTDRGELEALKDLLIRWGFFEYGMKISGDKKECVLVKKLGTYNLNYTPRQNFPNIPYKCNKYILAIYPEYHTALLPDSKLNNENKIDFLGREPHKYALQKVYITWASGDIKSGDMIIFYRTGEEGTIKKYSSVITTIAIVDEVKGDICSEEELLKICQNRSVFSEAELRNFWRRHNANLRVLKFIFVKSLTKRLILDYLWQQGIIPPGKGPRGFVKITDAQYDMIMRDSGTEIIYTKE